MAEEEGKSEHVVVSEAILLAGGSSFAYAVAFAYEAGVADHFGIPLQLIDLGLTTVFVGVFAVLLALSRFFQLWAVADPDTLTAKGPISVEVIILIRMFFFVVLPVGFVLGPERWIVTVIIAGSILVLLAFHWIGALIFFRGQPGFRAKLVAFNTAIYAGETRGFQTLTDRFGRYGNLVLFVAFTLLVSAAAGVVSAMDQQTFMVMASASTPEAVVLRIYSDHAVTCVFDRKTKELVPTYRIVAIDDPGFIFRREKLGKLRMRPVDTKPVETKRPPQPAPAQPVKLVPVPTKSSPATPPKSPATSS